MLARARVTVDLAKVRENARRVREALPAGIEIVGVTKVTCGAPGIARAMLDGGCTAIADSRLENIARMRGAGIEAPFWLLRAPTPDLANDTVRLADVSLESEIATVQALSAAAVRAGVTHRVIAMVDLGDLREGVMPDEAPRFFRQVDDLPGIELAGIGTSLTCYGGVVPSRENMQVLDALGRGLPGADGRRYVLSAGMSSSIELAVAGGMPAAVNNLRIGETILLGVSTVTREPILGLHTDAIVLEAPLIECKVKPSVPVGEIAQDAFGQTPAFEDLGECRRAILAIGRQDVDPAGLAPLDPRARILGASSDHLIVDVHELPAPLGIGNALAFVPNYSATLRLFTSPYVEKVFVG